ncbi:MAG: D-alanyl-D-alanine carboxypeptidase/D-alanyl-D-alanine-endopeptidase, partial [Proteobacteria bacterium]
MFKTLALAVFVFASLWLRDAAALEQIPEPVQRIIRTFKIPHSSISMIVHDVAAESPVVSLNPTVPRNPASAIKLLTTFVALDVLGPTYTWPTELYALGPINNGVLDGDLVLKGYGDPYLVVEEFWKMLGALRDQGVATINGDLVIDDSHFAVPMLDPGAFDRQPHRLYNVIPSATLVNFKAVEFRFTPASDGIHVRIRARPKLPNLTIIN